MPLCHVYLFRTIREDPKNRPLCRSDPIRRRYFVEPYMILHDNGAV